METLSDHVSPLNVDLAEANRLAPIKVPCRIIYEGGPKYFTTGVLRKRPTWWRVAGIARQAMTVHGRSSPVRFFEGVSYKGRVMKGGVHEYSLTIAKDPR